MNALVTGGGGFLGGAIVARLRARGDSVRSLSRGDYPALEALGVDELACSPLPAGRGFVSAAHGVLPLYTPLSGSWLNMTESVQRILIHRALKGHTPGSPQEIMTWLEQTARVLGTGQQRVLSRLFRCKPIEFPTSPRMPSHRV